MDVEQVRAAIRALPDHYMNGYECEWGCEQRYDSLQFPRTRPDCDMNEPDHDDELVSRRRVLELLDGAP